MRAAKAMLYFTKGYQETVHEVVKVDCRTSKSRIDFITTN